MDFFDACMNAIDRYFKEAKAINDSDTTDLREITKAQTYDACGLILEQELSKVFDEKLDEIKESLCEEATP